MNRTDDPSPLQRWRAPALIALVAWLVIELLLVGQAMHLDTFDVPGAIKLTLPRSLIWLIFAPLAAWLAFTFPLERARLARSLAVHLAACAALMMASHWAFYNIASVIAGRATHGQPSPPAQTINQALRSRGPSATAHMALAHIAIDVLLYAVS